MQAVDSSDLLVDSYQTSWRHIPEDISLCVYMVNFFLYDLLSSERCMHIQNLMSIFEGIRMQYAFTESTMDCPRNDTEDGMPVFRARLRKLPRQKALRGRNQPYITACDMEVFCFTECVRHLKYEANVTEKFIEIHIKTLLSEHLTCLEIFSELRRRRNTENWFLTLRQKLVI